MLLSPSPSARLFDKFFLRLFALGENSSMTPFLSLPLLGVSTVVSFGTWGLDLRFSEMSWLGSVASSEET